MATPGRFPQSSLRYRRLGGGYRAEDVELVLAECRLAVRQLERRVAPLRDRELELEAELDDLRAEIGALRTRQADLIGQVGAALSHSAKVEQLVRDQSLNVELLASAQTLDAQLRQVDETLRRQPVRLDEPEAAPKPSTEASAPAAAEPGPVPPAAEAEPPRDEPDAIRLRPKVAYDERPRVRPASSTSRRPPGAEVLALRDELRALELRRARAMAARAYSPALAIGVVAVGLATAVGLAVAGYGTAAVILLAAYTLAIAAVSVYGRPAGLAAVRPEHVPTPFDPPRPADAPLQDRRASPQSEAVGEEIGPGPEPVPAFDPAEAQRELAQLARERARRLVELGDAVEVGDDAAASEARSRLRELDALIASKEAELEAGATGNGGFGASGRGGEPVAAESQSAR